MQSSRTTSGGGLKIWGYNNDLTDPSLLYLSQSELDSYQIWYPESVENLFTHYNGEPCSVNGDDGIPLETAASPVPLTSHDTNVPTSDVISSNPTPSDPWSAFSTPAAKTNDTSPSTVTFTPSGSQSQSTAAYATPAAGNQHSDDHVEEAVEFRCPHCSEEKPTLGELNRHIKTHTLPYLCNFPGCRIGKATQRDLDRHKDTHGKTRLYFCPVPGCPWHVNGPKVGFSRRLDNAKRHLKSHANNHDLSVLREDSQGRLIECRGGGELDEFALCLSQLLKCHCAPIRDQSIEEAIDDIRNSYRYGDRMLLKNGIDYLLYVLEAMKLDVVIHHIRCLNPFRIEDNVSFEQKFFMKKIIAKRRANTGARLPRAESQDGPPPPTATPPFEEYFVIAIGKLSAISSSEQQPLAAALDELGHRQGTEDV
ncbi:T-complex protein 11 domain containing protein [Hyaloscypha variabilis]